MNILIPHSWLLEYLQTDVKPTEMQKILSLCGPSVERIYEREGDAVYDIEVTTNRVDSMSILGIAREAAVILQHANQKAKLKLPKLQAPATPEMKLQLPTILDDQKLCKRIMCIVLADVQRSATPEWMAKRMRQIDGNVHDAVIDTTNYITHELGHPCHAFDYDRIMELGGIIEVKTAVAGKKFTTLDGAEYTTVGGEVVFENGEGVIIDLPGIKGTANTSINQSTKNILFWLENIEAKKIRFASMTHSIRTVAAQLNERNVDPNLAESVLNRGVQLFKELTAAKIASPVYDHFPAHKNMAPVTVPLNRIADYLGLELPVNIVAQILEELGCEVSLKGETKVKNGTTQSPALIVTPPTFRPDIEIPADVIEEIARIYGYHNLPSVLMPTAIPIIRPTDVNFDVEEKVKRFLAAIGWQETYTYSMVSAEIATQSGFAISEHLKLLNPLSDDRVFMRRSLVPSLVEFIQNNPTVIKLQVFELAKVYHPQTNDLPTQPLQICLVSTRENREVKGSVEALYNQFFVLNLNFKPAKTQQPGHNQTAEIWAETEEGKPVLQGTIEITKTDWTAISIDVESFLQVVNSHPTYQAQIKTAEITEDLTFTLPAQTAVGELMSAVQSHAKYLVKIELKNIYQQNYAFRFTYQNPSQNLTAEDLAPIRKSVVALVKKQFNGSLVGELE